MFCRNCGKQVNETDKKCAYCNSEIDNGENLDNPSIQTSKENNKSSNNFIYILLVIIAAALAQATVHTYLPKRSSYKHNNINFERLENASFVYGFVAVNTQALNNFCKDSGHIPNKYINGFKKSFSKTIAKMNKDLNFYDSKLKINYRELLQKTVKINTSSYINDFKLVQQQAKASGKTFTKAQYCKYYDDEASFLIKQKITVFRNTRPDLFLD